MIDTGKLSITLNYAAEKVHNVTIESTRPLHISRLFLGKTPEHTLTLLPLLFNVCGTAQAYAAFTALTQALTIETHSIANTARQLLLSIEIIREHCWWLFIHKDKAKLAPFIQLVQQFKQALFINGNAFSLTSQLQINHTRLAELIEQVTQALTIVFANQRTALLVINDEVELIQWLENNNSIPAVLLNELLKNNNLQLGRSDLALLPILHDKELNDYLTQHYTADFSYAPIWQNKACETSCLNRQQEQTLIAELLKSYGNSVITRIVSRFIELAAMPELLKQYSIALQQAELVLKPNSINPNIGLAQIQASRGLLIHRVELIKGIISHYQIIAPTEWNFHAHGVVANSLQQLCAEDKTCLKQQASLIIKAIDPCVAFELIIL